MAKLAQKKKKTPLATQSYAFVFENRNTNNEYKTFILKNEQKSKIPVASLDFLTHMEFAEVQTLRRYEQLFILRFAKNSEKLN